MSLKTLSESKNHGSNRVLQILPFTDEFDATHVLVTIFHSEHLYLNINVSRAELLAALEVTE